MTQAGKLKATLVTGAQLKAFSQYDAMEEFYNALEEGYRPTEECDLFIYEDGIFEIGQLANQYVIYYM